jgi:hypothetical protein
MGDSLSTPSRSGGGGRPSSTIFNRGTLNETKAYPRSIPCTHDLPGRLRIKSGGGNVLVQSRRCSLVTRRWWLCRCNGDLARSQEGGAALLRLRTYWPSVLQQKRLPAGTSNTLARPDTRLKMSDEVWMASGCETSRQGRTVLETALGWCSVPVPDPGLKAKTI